MSRQADIRWTLVYWVNLKKLSIEDAIDLVDKIEGCSDAIGMAFDDSERIQFEKDYQDLVASVIYIWNQLEK